MIDLGVRHALGDKDHSNCEPGDYITGKPAKIWEAQLGASERYWDDALYRLIQDKMGNKLRR